MNNQLQFVVNKLQEKYIAKMHYHFNDNEEPENLGQIELKLLNNEYFICYVDCYNLGKSKYQSNPNYVTFNAQLIINEKHFEESIHADAHISTYKEIKENKKYPARLKIPTDNMYDENGNCKNNFIAFFEYVGIYPFKFGRPLTIEDFSEEDQKKRNKLLELEKEKDNIKKLSEAKLQWENAENKLKKATEELESLENEYFNLATKIASKRLKVKELDLIRQDAYYKFDSIFYSSLTPEDFEKINKAHENHRKEELLKKKNKD